jgi:hypothetical protein
MDFVIGHPRSGTQLVAQLLNAGGRAVAGHEHFVEQTLLGTLIEAATEYYEGRVSADEVKELLLAREPSSLVIDCDWKLTWILPPLLDLFPDARFVHLARDPRANVIACHNLDYHGELASHPEVEAYPVMSRWLRAMPRVDRPDWDALSQLEKNCAFWAETHALARRVLAPRSERYLLLRLEDLGDSATAAALHRFLDLPVPPDEAIARVLSSEVNAKTLDKQIVARFKSDMLPPFDACPADVKGTLVRHCGPIAEALGYRLGSEAARSGFVGAERSLRNSC